MGDKYAIEIIKIASKTPDDLKEQIEDILTIDQNNLSLKIKRLRNLFNKVFTLADGQYQPIFKL